MALYLVTYISLYLPFSTRRATLITVIIILPVWIRNWSLFNFKDTISRSLRLVEVRLNCWANTIANHNSVVWFCYQRA